MAYETGAKTAASNNLVLSVLNDGAIYNTRKHCGFALLQGINTAITIKDLVKNEAQKQRLTGSKFTLSDIKNAADLIHAETIGHCLELIRDEYLGNEITAHGRRWFDKVNGNSYFSVNVKIGKHAINIPFQYGYGSQWESETNHILNKIGITTRQKINFIDSGYMTKKMMFEGLYI